MWFGSAMRRRWTRIGLARLLWAALACWAAGILLLSALTPQELPEAAFLFWDKVNHFAAYAVGGWLAAAALRLSRPQAGTAGAVLLAVVLIAAFGVADEAFQTLTPGRSGANFDDWVADALGATAGALLTLPTLDRLRRAMIKRRGARRSLSRATSQRTEIDEMADSSRTSPPKLTFGPIGTSRRTPFSLPPSRDE